LKKLDYFRAIIRALSQLDDAPAPDPQRKASAKHTYLEYAAQLKAKERANHRLVPMIFARSWRSALAGAMAIALAMGSLTGAAYAADRTRPGDLLYPVDREIENLQFRLASEPDQKISLLLSFADERLLEVQQLVELDSQDNMIVALDAYRDTILTISQTIDDEPAEYDFLVSKVDNEFMSQEERLMMIRQRVPEQARPGLDRAIEALHRGDEEIPLEDSPEEAGPPVNPPVPLQTVVRPDPSPGPPSGISTGPPSGVATGPPGGVPASQSSSVSTDPADDSSNREPDAETDDPPGSVSPGPPGGVPTGPPVTPPGPGGGEDDNEDEDEDDP
jgi:hypothetical protein